MKQRRLTKRQVLYLHLLKTSKPKQRKVLLSSIENGFIKILSEAIYNVLHGYMSLGNDKIRQLRRYKQSLQTLSKRYIPLVKKRTVLQQYGGGGNFYRVLIPIISSAFSNPL